MTDLYDDLSPDAVIQTAMAIRHGRHPAYQGGPKSDPLANRDHYLSVLANNHPKEAEQIAFALAEDAERIAAANSIPTFSVLSASKTIQRHLDVMRTWDRRRDNQKGG